MLGVAFVALLLPAGRSVRTVAGAGLRRADAAASLEADVGVVAEPAWLEPDPATSRCAQVR